MCRGERRYHVKILGHCFESRSHIAIFVSPSVMKAVGAMLMQDVGEVTSKALESYRGSRGIAPLILNVGGEWLTLRRGRFIPVPIE